MGKNSMQKIPDALKTILKEYRYSANLGENMQKTWDEVRETDEVVLTYCNKEEFSFNPKKPLTIITISTLSHYLQSGLDDTFITIELLKKIGAISCDFADDGKVLILDNGQFENERKQKFKIHESSVRSFVFTKESLPFFKLIEEKY